MQAVDLCFPPNFPPPAEGLVGDLLHMEPGCRLGSASTGGYSALRSHAFFSDCSPPIDFTTVGATPPPPLSPPPPFPAFGKDDMVLNAALASHELSEEERAQLLQSQVLCFWCISRLLHPAAPSQTALCERRLAALHHGKRGCS
eukprot:scaffold171153_cov37-Tisochrysis_lutea.AAC.2